MLLSFLKKEGRKVVECCCDGRVSPEHTRIRIVRSCYRCVMIMMIIYISSENRHYRYLIDRVCLMVFVGVVICLVSVIIIGFRMWYMATGKVVEGQIVGYVKGARSLYAQQGYNYRICLTYKGETYYVTSVDSF